MRRLLLCALLVMVAPAFALAQTLPGEEPRPKEPKSLTDKQVREYKAGGDAASLSRLAELYHYPLPSYVMTYASELNLSDEQAKTLLASRKRTQATAKKLGAEIIAKERELEDAFETETVSPDELTRLTTDISVLHARLRAAYLYSALEMKTLLTPEQLAKYREIRSSAAPLPSAP